ncbi:MAG: divergent polysaccharide deacetylase family protein [Pseudomonadota bacterium]
MAETVARRGGFMSGGFMSGVLTGACIGVALAAMLALLAPQSGPARPMPVATVSVPEAEVTEAEVPEAEVPEADVVPGPTPGPETAPTSDPVPAPEAVAETVPDTEAVPAAETAPEVAQEADTAEDVETQLAAPDTGLNTGPDTGLNRGPENAPASDPATADARTRDTQVAVDTGAETELELTAESPADPPSDAPVDTAVDAPEDPARDPSADASADPSSEAPDEAPGDAPVAARVEDSADAEETEPQAARDPANADAQTPNEAARTPRASTSVQDIPPMIIEPSAAPPLPDPDPQGRLEREPAGPRLAATDLPAPVTVGSVSPLVLEARWRPRDPHTVTAAWSVDLAALQAARLAALQAALQGGRLTLAAPGQAGDAVRDPLPVTDTDPAAPPPDQLPPAPIPDVPAWQAYGAPPPSQDDGPAIAILLMMPQTATLDISLLIGAGLPVSIVLRSDDPSTRAMAPQLRAAGFELFVAPSGDQALVAGLSEDEVTQRLEAAFARVPEAVGIIDPDGGLGRDPQLSLAAMPSLMRRGHAAVTATASARNVMARIAPEHGVRHMIVNRRLDGSDQPALRAALDRAAFAARNDGDAVALAEATPNVMAVIVDWATSREARQQMLAPGSTLLARQEVTAPGG